jgi:hypothetical protein
VARNGSLTNGKEMSPTVNKESPKLKRFVWTVRRSENKVNVISEQAIKADG